jgi:plasmid maintenance system antidote protein VapI
MNKRFQQAYHYVLTAVKHAVATVATTAVIGLPAYAQSHVVKPGESISRIARHHVTETSLTAIIKETDSIARMNGMAPVSAYPWHEGYDCTDQPREDPNCIEPGQRLMTSLPAQQRSVRTVSVTETEQDEAIPFGYGVGFVGLLAGVFGYRAKRRAEHKQRLTELVSSKNTDPYQSIDRLVEAHGVSFDAYFNAQQNGSLATRIERYDHTIAPQAMVDAYVDAYQHSEDSLDDVSERISAAYGMNVSSSTISRRAREILDVESRREARDEAADREDAAEKGG